MYHKYHLLPPILHVLEPMQSPELHQGLLKSFELLCQLEYDPELSFQCTLDPVECVYDALPRVALVNRFRLLFHLNP
jgi:hypothetical protein